MTDLSVAVAAAGFEGIQPGSFCQTAGCEAGGDMVLVASCCQTMIVTCSPHFDAAQPRTEVCRCRQVHRADCWWVLCVPAPLP